MPSLVVSFSHSDADIDRTVAGIDEALGVYRKALEDGVEKYLVGRPVKPVFRDITLNRQSAEWLPSNTHSSPAIATSSESTRTTIG